MNTAVNARALTKKYSHPTTVDVLRGIDIRVSQGETVAIMGASGEGKSTLLHILGTLESPTTGNVTVMGEQVSARNKNTIRNTHLGFVFQAFHLLEDYTTIDNVLMPAAIARQSVQKGSDTYLHGMSLLEQVHLEDRATFPVKLLSGGERQRVAIARALCNNPDIILADEPSGNLDHATSHDIHSLLFQCAQENNMALIIVTHNTELASLCDTVYTLQNGTASKRSGRP